ncbi:hypothetical protein E4U11_007509 [Claviceps purpurea]|nr:hypothetical protein E4U11_007509 [Claviceps purpurea]
MVTPRDIDSDGLSYQSDDDDYDGTFAPDEPEYTHLQYPDEVLEEACHPWGTSQHAPSNAAAKKYAKALVNRPDHIFKAVCRLTRYQVFTALLNWLRGATNSRDKKYRTCEQKMMVSLYIMGFGETQRYATRRFRMSQRSVGRIFHEVLSHMPKLHKAFFKCLLMRLEWRNCLRL